MNKPHEKSVYPVLKRAYAVVAYEASEIDHGVRDGDLICRSSSSAAKASDVSRVYLGFVRADIDREDKGRIKRPSGVRKGNAALMCIDVPAMKYANRT